MNNLDKSWMLLILFGIIFFASTVGWDIFEAVTGSNSEFSVIVVNINDPTLITEELKTHLESGSDLRSYEPDPIIEDLKKEEIIPSEF